MAGNRASIKQLELLLSYMEAHSLFARGQITALGPSGHTKYKDMWENLCQELNELGPSTKNISQWETCWRKLRLSAKEKKAQYLNAMRRTGNVGKIIPLSDFDERICEIFGNYGIGVEIIQEVGIYKIDSDNWNDDSTELNAYSTRLPCNNSSILIDFQHLHKQLLDRLHSFEQPICQSLRILNSLIDNQISQKQQRVRSNKGQLKFLISFMERNKTFASGEVDRDVYTEQWKQLASDLNSITGEDKSVDSWQRCWKDQIRQAKGKKEDYLQFKRNQPLTDFDNRILLAAGEDLPSRREKNRPSISRDIEKRSFDNLTEPCTSGLKKFKSVLSSESDALNLMQQQNILLEKLVKEISLSYQKQATILQEGLDQINVHMRTIIQNIIRLFGNSHSKPEKLPDRPDSNNDNNLNDNNDMPDDDSHSSDQYDMEYLDESFL